MTAAPPSLAIRSGARSGYMPWDEIALAGLHDCLIAAGRIGSDPGFRETAPPAGGDQRVAQETGNRHRPDAARHRRDRAGDAQRFGEGDIADEAALAALAGH